MLNLLELLGPRCRGSHRRPRRSHLAISLHEQNHYSKKQGLQFDFTCGHSCWACRLWEPECTLPAWGPWGREEDSCSWPLQEEEERKRQQDPLQDDHRPHWRARRTLAAPEDGWWPECTLEAGPEQSCTLEQHRQDEETLAGELRRQAPFGQEQRPCARCGDVFERPCCRNSNSSR